MSTRARRKADKQLDTSGRRPTVSGTQVFLETSTFRTESREKPSLRILSCLILERRQHASKNVQCTDLPGNIGRFKSSADLFLRGCHRSFRIIFNFVVNTNPVTVTRITRHGLLRRANNFRCGRNPYRALFSRRCRIARAR